MLALRKTNDNVIHDLPNILDDDEDESLNIVSSTNYGLNQQRTQIWLRFRQAHGVY